MEDWVFFYKGKSDCKAIMIATWDLGHNLCGVSEGKAQKLFGPLMSSRWLNSLNSIKKTIFLAEEAIPVYNQPVFPG